MDGITITGITKLSEEWEEEMNKALDPGWFDCIARHLEEYGVTIHCKTAKRKACYVRCARSGCYLLQAGYYKKDFGQQMPTNLDGKDWKPFALLPV